MVEREPERALGVTVDGVPVERVVVPPDRFGTELVRATGSEAYVGALGALPTAATRTSSSRRSAFRFCRPSCAKRLRRHAACARRASAIRGDLHVHTTWSDGKASVLEMAEAARELGYEYIAICDHTKNVRVVPGLDADDLRRQAEEIAEANERLAPFRVLRGSECDILADGTLDLPDDVLAELDWVQASVHAGQRQSRDQLTKRTLAAVAASRGPVDQPSAGPHPQPPSAERRRPRGRLRGVRRERARRSRRTACPTGSTSARSSCARRSAPACASRARRTRTRCAGSANMRLSVATARRGWATAADVLNTRGLDELLAQKR